MGTGSEFFTSRFVREGWAKMLCDIVATKLLTVVWQ